MLRLEHIGKTGDVHISLRGRETRWNRTFLLALGGAIAIHLLGWLLFQVHPFRITYSGSLFPPIEVNITLGQGGTSADVQETVSSRHLRLKPATTRPTLPSIPLATIERVGHTYTASSGYNPFLAAERKRLPLLLEEGETILHAPIEVTVSGGLAEVPFSFDGSNAPAIRPHIAHAFAFDVRIDASTGRIFWYEQTRSENQRLLSQAEAILKNLQFKKMPQALVRQGQVCVTLYEEGA